MAMVVDGVDSDRHLSVETTVIVNYVSCRSSCIMNYISINV